MKKLIIGVVAAIVVVIVAALAAPFLIPTDTYKNRVIALVEQATGRQFRIDGPVRLALLPQLEVDAKGVALANAPGASQPDMLSLKELQVQLKLLPLLHGTIELGRFVLTAPVIALEVDKAGRPNWAFAAAAPAPRQNQGAAAAPQPASPAPPAPGAAGPRSATFSELSLNEVSIVDGKISYRDDRTGKTQELDGVAMKLSLPNLDSAFAGEGAAVWNGQKVSLSLGVAKPRALLGGAKSGLSLRLAAAPLTVGFTGDATGLPPARLTGVVDLAVPSLRDLAKWVGAAMPAGGGLQHLAIKGKLDMQGPKIAFSDATIALDAIAAQGALAVDAGGARPALTGKLQLAKLDLNPYLPPEAKAKGAPAAERSGAAAPAAAPVRAPAAAAAGWSDAPLDLAALDVADADLALSVGGLDYRKIEIGPSALDLHLKNGKLAIDLTQLSLYQGKGQAKVTLDGSGAVPAMTLSVDLAGVQVGPLLEAAADMDRLSGAGKLSFDVAGSGKSQRALVSALNGKGAFDLTNGEIKGVNLIALAENPATAVSGGSDKTDFGSLTGTFTITNGVVRNNDLQLKSGPIPVTGAGTVSLPARNVNYRLTVNLAGAIGVPVLVSGPWDNLSYRPDLASLARDPGKLIDTLKNLKSGAGGASGGAGGSGSAPNPASLLKGLFGR